MNLHSLGKGLRVSAIALARYVTAFSAIVLFVYKVVSCPKCNEAGIICWCWDGNRAGAADISVTELVGEDLKLICCKPVVIPKDIVMGRSACTLNACMTAKIEVKLKGMSDVCVHCCSCWDVSTFANPLVFIRTEEASVMPFLNNNVSDAWLVIFLQFDAGVADG